MQKKLSHPALSNPTPTDSSFVKRCQSAGLSIVTIDPEGRLLASHPRLGGAIDSALMSTSLFTNALRRLSGEWAKDPEPVPCEVWPGCHLVPIPVFHRRQLSGYQVAVLVTRVVAVAPQFAALCAASCLREADARLRVLEHSPGESEAGLWASFLRWMHDDLATMDRRAMEIDDLTKQLGGVYEELSLVYKLSARMSVTHDPMSFLLDALKELQEVLGIRWAAVRLSDEEPRLHTLRGRLLTVGYSPCDENTLDRVGAELMQRKRLGDQTCVEDASSLGLSGKYPQMGPVLVIPIARDNRRLAVFFGGEKLDGDTFSSVDAKLATAAAQNLAIFLENGMLYVDMEDIFMGTLHALVSSIDAKDSYTFGHSERVALVSREIASAAGLDESQVERVYLSALVHDVGKIGVPEAVLTKPGKLTAAEYEIVKLHPEMGVKILERIPQMHDLLPGVLHHHERYDGTGYPHRLSGNKIPLMGRIIGIADAFDAMSSCRTYRGAIPVEEVFKEIERCSGTQFDPELTRAFIKNTDLSQFYTRLAEHQDRTSSLRQLLRKTA